MLRRVLPVVAVLLTAACAGGGEAKSEADTEPVPTTPGADVPIDQTVFAADLGVDIAASTQTATGLYYRDLVVGEGATVTAGQTVDVYYDGRLTDGTKFDATKIGSPFTFQAGMGKVIAGWDEGVVGMKIGGKRQLIIPPALGYGPSGVGPIPPNAILYFTVEVLDAR